MSARTIKVALAIVVYGALASVALAQSIGGMNGVGPRIGAAGGNGGGGPVCANTFDFSQACNSQYLGFM